MTSCIGVGTIHDGTMITASHLTKTFGPVTAVADVSFHIDSGEIVGFLGPNGAGKTTTMRILAGVFPPTSGKVSVAGYDVFEESLQARRMIGYMPEVASFYPELSVRQYLRFVGRLKHLDRSRRREAVAAVLGSCLLEDVADRLVGKLSKGYRQRLALAQALLADPPVLILDEPTIGLDPEQVVEIRSLIASFTRRKAVLFSSHILSEIEAICSRILVLNRGRIVAGGTPSELSARLGARRRIVLRVDAPRDEVLRAMARVPSIVSTEPDDDSSRIVAEVDDGDAAGRALSEVIRNCGWTILELRHEALPLEEIFLRLVANSETGPLPGEGPHS